MKHSPAFMFAALGLLVGCGPIAFNDSISFQLAKPAPTPKLETQPEAPKTRPMRARLTGTRIEISEKIQFEHDSAEIKAESHSLLDEVVTVLKDNPRIEQLDIVGFTSSEGSKAHNNKLSTDRAASVKQYLVDAGIDAGRLSSQGKGPTEPIASNDTEEGRVANRRVEFHVIKMGGADGVEGGAAKGGMRAKPGAK